ncbi:MAG TPA: thiamine phosphate synthase [Dermatophilaceae bacterium]|nr:thiamine phosphate synthase [Dermatophilaceae bacterium]
MTDTALCGEFGVTATVSAAVTAGVTLVQLRDPLATDAELVALGRSIRQVLQGVPLIVNDRVHLVAEIGADGAHVGQADLPVTDARAMLGDAAYLGLSVQTVEQVAAAGPLAALDYLGAGPVWPQSTKPDAADPGGLDMLAGIVARSPWPVVAIGGVTAAGMPLLRSAGAAGGAVVSAICGQPDVTAATAALRAAWERAA